MSWTNLRKTGDPVHNPKELVNQRISESDENPTCQSKIVNPFRLKLTNPVPDGPDFPTNGVPDKSQIVNHKAPCSSDSLIANLVDPAALRDGLIPAVLSPVILSEISHE